MTNPGLGSWEKSFYREIAYFRQSFGVKKRTPPTEFQIRTAGPNSGRMYPIHIRSPNETKILKKNPQWGSPLNHTEAVPGHKNYDRILIRINIIHTRMKY